MFNFKSVTCMFDIFHSIIQNTHRICNLLIRLQMFGLHVTIHLPLLSDKFNFILNKNFFNLFKRSTVFSNACCSLSIPFPIFLTFKTSSQGILLFVSLNTHSPACGVDVFSITNQMPFCQRMIQLLTFQLFSCCFLCTSTIL